MQKVGNVEGVEGDHYLQERIIALDYELPWIEHVWRHEVETCGRHAEFRLTKHTTMIRLQSPSRPTSVEPPRNVSIGRTCSS